MVAQKILILGASYGSLLAAKALLAGHDITLVCLPNEADLINSEGFRVRLPLKGADAEIELNSRRLGGRAVARGPDGIVPEDYDLVGLAMQEPQLGAPGVRELLDAIGKSRVPCMSIMNMPPLPYMLRIPGIDCDAIKPAYTDPDVWRSFMPSCVTLCSPDPQAVRPPREKCNVLQVTLPTNFKVARFDDAGSTALLRQLEREIDSIRYRVGEGEIELPVKLRVHDSIFVPLAKWSMLLAGNYRCITDEGMRTAYEAVHADLAESRSVYDFVSELCVKLGAHPASLVPFEKYATAAKQLSRPSSAARALQNGARNIERTDKLVQLLGCQKGMSHPVVDSIVRRIDLRLAANRVEPAVLRVERTM